jgi:hypothetical protein
VRPAVVETPELRRILDLPRRALDPAAAQARAEELTPLLALRGDVELRPWQGLSLWEMAENGGAYLGLPVGTGKTLISWLAPTVLDAARPVLCVPAGLRDKTHGDFRAYHGVWAPPPAPIRVISYEELTQVDNVDMLSRWNPDLLILDESDCLRNGDSSATRRIDRFVRDFAPRVVCMTGTVGRTSILDCSHHLLWILDDRAPIPMPKAERELWAAALDEKNPRVGQRPRLGALEMLGGGPTLEGARKAYGERLQQTPGVILVDEDSCDQPLTISVLQAPPDPVIDLHFKRFREAWVTPDQWPLSDPLSVYRHAGELGTGMYLKWDPRPPEWWLEPRRVFCAFVRALIQQSHRQRRPLDTELAVRRACPGAYEVVEWLAVKPEFTPNSVPVWLSSSVVDYAARWARESPGLVWCWNRDFAEALSRATGLANYGAQGLDAAGRYIERADPTRSAILSVSANMRGRNLQGWCRNLVINPPQSARYLEQIIGRTHRQGQRRPVSVDILATSGDVLDAFDAAWREATFQRRTTGIAQKLLRAELRRAKLAFVDNEDRARSAFRWARKEIRTV